MNVSPDAVEPLNRLADRALSMLDPIDGEPRALRPHAGLLVLSHQRPSDHRAQVYEPVVCLVLSGAKETNTTDRAHPIAAGQFLIVTHDLPVTSRITEAAPSAPYVALIASLDREILADLAGFAAQRGGAEDEDPHALRVGTAEPELVDAFDRFLRALERRDDTEALAPLIQREIHYRLLNSSQGAVLRRLAFGDRTAAPIARAIDLIRSDLSARLSVGSIARHVGLSSSAFHHHFKAVTGTSPVQYQKQLRLLEARRLIQSNIRTVTDAAYSVGYSSPTQFSREYSRAFGHPPSQDRVLVATG